MPMWCRARPIRPAANTRSSRSPSMRGATTATAGGNGAIAAAPCGRKRFSGEPRSVFARHRIGQAVVNLVAPAHLEPARLVRGLLRLHRLDRAGDAAVVARVGVAGA